MKGFKNSTKTQMGHGYADEVPTRPATSKDVAAAKAVRIVTPSKPAAKPQPRVTDAMLRGEGEDKAPGERGAKRFAVGGEVSRPSNRVSFDESFDNKGAYYTPSKSEPVSFKQAFRENRAAGKETFMWNGKRYTTELADSAPKTSPKASPQASVANKPPVKSVPVAPSSPRIAAKSEDPNPIQTKFRRDFSRSMGDDSPAAKAKADAKAAARGKAVRDVVNFVLKGDGKPHPSFRENFSRSMGDDKPKRFAVGGVVPPRSGGMPAQGKPIMNANDARTAPPMQNGQRPMVAPRPTRNSGLPQAWRDNYAADRSRRLGGQDTATRSTGKPAEPVRPTSAQMAALPTTKAYKRGGKVVEKGTGEVYASKATMKKHEGKETKAQERAEHYAKGGSPKSKWC